MPTPDGALGPAPRGRGRSAAAPAGRSRGLGPSSSTPQPPTPTPPKNPKAEDAEDVDILDDVLLLSDQPPPAPPGASPDAALSSAPDGGALAAEGLDRWLAGVLPGGGADAAARGFAEELFAEDDAAGDEEVEAAI